MFHEPAHAKNTISDIQDNIAVLDVSDKANIVKLSQFSYDQVSYTHQGWLSSDKSHLVLRGV